MSRALLVLWVATLGADRVDLLRGDGPFVLKPLLVLLAPILIVELLRLARRDRRLHIPPGTPWFFVALTTLICVFLVSLMLAQELGLGLRRLALLGVESYATLLIVLALANRVDWREILVRGAWLGLLLMAVFDLVQISRWAGGHAFGWLELGGVIDLTPATYGPWLPRPSGVAIDPNRGGLLTIIYLFVLTAYREGRRGSGLALLLGIPLLLLTLSRSAMLAAVVLAGVWLLRRRLGATPGGVVVLGMTGAVIAAALILSPALQGVTLEMFSVMGRRASVSEGSSSMHLSLISHGWEVATASVGSAVQGVGFGNSYLVLQEFFPGDKYGNFHSAYVTLLVEAGVVAVAIFLVLLVWPFLRGSSFAPLLAGLLAFNVFYQTHVEAAFWFVVALAWIMPGTMREVAEAEEPAREGWERPVLLAHSRSSG